MRWSKLSVALAGAALLGCEPPSMTQQQAAVETQFLNGRVSEWTTAVNNGALDTLLALYERSPYVMVVWPDGRKAVGTEENEQKIEDNYNLWEMVNYGPISPEVDLLNDHVAVVAFSHSLDIRFFDSRRQVASGHTTLVFVKDETDGIWRIRTQHMSINPPRSISGR